MAGKFFRAGKNLGGMERSYEVASGM